MLADEYLTKSLSLPWDQRLTEEEQFEKLAKWSDYVRFKGLPNKGQRTYIGKDGFGDMDLETIGQTVQGMEDCLDCFRFAMDRQMLAEQHVNHVTEALFDQCCNQFAESINISNQTLFEELSTGLASSYVFKLTNAKIADLGGRMLTEKVQTEMANCMAMFVEWKHELNQIFFAYVVDSVSWSKNGAKNALQSSSSSGKSRMKVRMNRATMHRVLREAGLKIGLDKTNKIIDQTLMDVQEDASASRQAMHQSSIANANANGVNVSLTSPRGSVSTTTNVIAISSSSSSNDSQDGDLTFDHFQEVLFRIAHLINKNSFNALSVALKTLITKNIFPNAKKANANMVYVRSLSSEPVQERIRHHKPVFQKLFNRYTHGGAFTMKRSDLAIIAKDLKLLNVFFNIRDLNIMEMNVEMLDFNEDYQGDNVDWTDDINEETENSTGTEAGSSSSKSVSVIDLFTFTQYLCCWSQFVYPLPTIGIGKKLDNLIAEYINPLLESSNVPSNKK
jgi:hypothetical protein